VFKEEPELEWFKKRFNMFQDILSESWVYREIVEQGVEKGREEERQRRIQDQRTMLIGLIQFRFPELLALAKQQTDGITDPEVLPPVNSKLIAVQTIEEARQILLSVDKSGTKH
jgi:predicted transposase YdaD